jgi:hypothetical protein
MRKLLYFFFNGCYNLHHSERHQHLDDREVGKYLKNINSRCLVTPITIKKSIVQFLRVFIVHLTAFQLFTSWV